MEEVIEQLKKEVEAENAEITDVDNLDTKDFARTPDPGFKGGIFVEIDFRSPGYRPNALHERLRLNKTVDRVMVRNLD